MLKHIVVVFIALLSLQSCEDFFATTLQADPPAHTDQMVVHSYLSAGDSSIFVAVGKSIALLENDITLDQLSDAEVEVFQGGQSLGQLVQRDPAVNSFYNYELLFDQPLRDLGTDFELRVNHPNFPNTTARQNLPTKVPPRELKYLENAGINDFGERVAGMEVIFDDPPGERNFYEISVLFVDTFYNEFFVYNEGISTLDPTISSGANYGSLIFDDSNFDGKEYVLRVEFQSSGVAPGAYLVSWNTISESQFLYSRSIQAYYSAQDSGPFAEPVSLYSNVDNGLGIFGAANGDFYPLEE
ncbi:MAG: DUF4249 domain-containing protein [Bacteroidota bacterium]